MTIPALTRLQQDHRNIETLLRLLEQQQARLGDGYTPDFALMEDILHYLTRYQDRYHHPFEELLTRRLVLRRPDSVAEIDELQTQHRRLSCSADALEAILIGVQKGLIVPRTDLQALFIELIQAYREHIRHEEQVIYPAFASALSNADWLELVTAFQWRFDPVFSKAAAPEYRALRDAITSGETRLAPGSPEMIRPCPICLED